MIIYLLITELITELKIKKLFRYSILFLTLPTILNSAPPLPRKHNTNQIFSSQYEYPADVSLSIPSQFSVKKIDKLRIIDSNGIPNHKVGKFPNSGNPHSIKPQKYKYKFQVHILQKLKLIFVLPILIEL